MKVTQAIWKSEALERSLTIGDLPGLRQDHLDLLRLEVGDASEAPISFPERRTARLFYRACCSEYNARQRRLAQLRFETYERDRSRRHESSISYGHRWREALRDELLKVNSEAAVDALYAKALERARQ